MIKKYFEISLDLYILYPIIHALEATYDMWFVI